MVQVRLLVRYLFHYLYVYFTVVIKVFTLLFWHKWDGLCYTIVTLCGLNHVLPLQGRTVFQVKHLIYLGLFAVFLYNARTSSENYMSHLLNATGLWKIHYSMPEWCQPFYWKYWRFIQDGVPALPEIGTGSCWL